MAGSGVWATVGNEASKWSDRLLSYGERARLAQQQALKDQEQKAQQDRENVIRDAIESRAKEIHKQNLAEFDAKKAERDNANIDAEMMRGAMGQIPIQYPEGITATGAVQLFQEQGVIDNPEAQKIINMLQKTEQPDENNALKMLLAGMYEKGRNERAAESNKTRVNVAKIRGTSKKPENLEGSLAGLIAEDERLKGELSAFGNPSGYVKLPIGTQNEIKRLSGLRMNVGRKIADVKAKIGAQMQAKDPAVQAESSDPMGLFN